MPRLQFLLLQHFNFFASCNFSSCELLHFVFWLTCNIKVCCRFGCNFGCSQAAVEFSWHSRWLGKLQPEITREMQLDLLCCLQVVGASFGKTRGTGYGKW